MFDKESGIRPPNYCPEKLSPPEEVIVIRTHEFSEIIRRLKKVPIKGDFIPGFYPYHPSTITLEEFPLDHLQPCSLYVLRPQLDILRRLRKAFLKTGTDILDLPPETSLVEYFWGNESKHIIGPPVIEVSEDDGGTQIMVDGLHRTLIAMETGKNSIVGVKITNVAIPLAPQPVEWDEVQFCDSVPSTEAKRRFRLPNLKDNLDWIRQNYPRFMSGFESPETTPAEYFFYRWLKSAF